MSAFLTVGARQLNDLTNQVQAYEGLLRDIRPELDALSAQKVEQVLKEVSAHSHPELPFSFRGDLQQKGRRM